MSIIRTISQYGLAEIFSKASPFLFLLIAAQELGPEKFGELSLWIVYYEGLYILISNNIQAVARVFYYKKSKNEMRAFAKGYIVYSTLVALLTCVTALYFFSYWYMCIFYALLILLRTVNAYFMSIMQCSLDTLGYVKASMGYSLIYMMSGIAGLSLDMELNSWILAISLAAILQTLIIAKQFDVEGGIKRALHHKADKIQLSILIGELKFGWMLMPAAFGWWLKVGGERHLVSQYYTQTDLGIYAYTTQIASIVYIIAGAVNLALLPMINSKIKEGKKYEIAKIIGYWHVFAIAISLIIYCFAYFMIDGDFINEKFKRSIDMLPYIIPGALLHSLVIIMSNVIYYLGGAGVMAITIMISFAGWIAAGYLILQYSSIQINNFMLYANAPLFAIYAVVALMVLKHWRRIN